MTYKEIESKLDHEVIVTCIDGQKIRGFLYNTVSSLDTSSGKEEVEIMADVGEYGIPFEEIKDIIIVD